MNNQAAPNESFDELRSEEDHSLPLPNTPRSHNQITPLQEEYSPHVELAHLETLQQIPQPILESSREGGNGSWQEGESSRYQQEVVVQPERNGGQTYYRIGPNGEREIIHVTTISPIPPGQVQIPFPPQPLLPLQQQAQMPAHFPPSPRMSHPPPQKPSQLKSLDNLRNITQQSFAPSQKTIVLNHIANQMGGGVYHSHVSTERMPIQAHQRQPNTRHSHVHDTRMGSPSRVSFDYTQNKPEIGRNLFSSYIPTGAPAPLPQRGNATSTSNAPQPSERQYQHPEQAIFWREKYEELGRRWQATRVKESKEQQVAASKFTALQKNYQLLQSSYDQLVQDYHAKLDENQEYYQQIQQLQGLVNQLQLAPKRSEESQEDLQAALEEKSMLVGLLKKENQQFQGHLQTLQQRHEQELREMHEHATMLQMEVQQREAQLRERAQLKTSTMRRSDNSQLVLDRSRMESFENTRVMELEMHVGKLNSELNMREESFERQLRMANLNVAELVEKLRSQAQQKDQIIRNLQEKVGLLQSDLNKKDSLIRNLRDEAARMPSQGASPSQPAASVYSSAVNPVDHRKGDSEQSVKRELQNIRRNLFQRERQKLILKQKYEELQERALQSEQALNRRKLQNQAMRRQLNEFDNLQHQNEKLMEVLNKKNAELMEVKEMLMEKEQHAGDFENLSKENDRLRAFMLKKNQELSQLAERLYNQQKRAREIELAHTPQIHQLQQQLHHMEQALARKDIQISKLNQSLQLIQGNFSEIEFELQRHKNINQEYEAQIKANIERIQAEQEEIAAINGEKHLLEIQVSALRDKMREYMEEIAHQQELEADALWKLEQAETALKAREEQLRTLSTQQCQLRQFKHKSTKEIQIIQTKHVDLQARCRDLQSLIRNREQRLARAQKQVEQGREQLKKHQSCSKQIQQMSERISHYEMRIISLTLNRSRSGLTDYPPPSQVFENKLIYNLKADNEALRQQLASIKADPIIQSERSPPSSPKGSDIKQRLDQFNNNLQSAIGGGLKRVRSLQALQTMPVAQQQTRQIQRLKQLAQEMQRQELEESFSRRKSISPQQLEQLYQEQVAFYRTSNLQLEQRVNSLLRLNKELKQQLEQAVQNKGASIKTFYQDEMRRLQREVTTLRQQKSRSNQSTKLTEKRIRQLEQQLRSRRRGGGQPSELGYNFDLMRPALSPRVD